MTGEEGQDSDKREGRSATAVPGGRETALAMAHGDAGGLWADELDNSGAALHEDLSDVLDIGTWRNGADLAALYDTLRTMVADSVAQSRRTRGPIRRILVEHLRDGSEKGRTPEEAGFYRLDTDDIRFVHENLLFNGAVEACDGTVVSQDSLLLTVAQIGVSLVAYQGNSGTWVQRLYRRDVSGTYPDPEEEAVQLLERRGRRSDSADADQTRDPLSRLLRRGLMEYAERAVLLKYSTAPWRLGHGNPIPTLLLVPTTPELLRRTLETLESLLLEHRKFVYVASSPSDRLARTLGDALEPLEYAVVGSIRDLFDMDRLTDAVTGGHPRERKALRSFLERVLPEIVYGVYRVAPHSPAQVFYAHRQHAHVAAAIAMADSTLQPHRGFPMLIDLADLVCRTTFDAGSFTGTVRDAYAVAGEPTRYLGERETRS